MNTRVLRSGSDWEEPETVIEDATRSGKQKRRLAYSSGKRVFNVAFNFTAAEYEAFRNWFTVSLRRGIHTFMFPQIDSPDKSRMREYRIKVGGFPKYQNTTGKSIRCTMTWEEE